MHRGVQPAADASGGRVVQREDCREIAVDRQVHGLLQPRALRHADLHQLHEADGTHEDDVALDLRAQSPALVAAEGIDAVVAAVLAVHHLVKQRDEAAARRLHDGRGEADDLAHRTVGIDLHAVERDAARREEVLIGDGHGALSAEDARAAPARDGRAIAVETGGLPLEGTGKAEEQAGRERSQQHGRPRPEEIMLAAERGQHGKRQRQQRGDRRADARAALRGVRHFELGGKRRAVAGDAEDTVGAVPGGSFANGAGGRRHAADGLHRAVFGGF